MYAFSGAERKDKQAILKMGGKMETAQTWLGFLSADESNAANSMYCGSVEIRIRAAKYSLLNTLTGLMLLHINVNKKMTLYQ